jgi:hypothetical protein
LLNFIRILFSWIQFSPRFGEAARPR